MMSETFHLAIPNLSRRHVVLGILIVVVVLSAFSVIYAAFQTRQLYGEIQLLQSRQDELDSEYEKLLLEQGAWANYTRVDQVSRKDLSMRPPLIEEIVLVER